jgi:threonine aldolase
MKTYDVRSDTITKPSEGMRKAIYEAEVGDDVYSEDPSINKLQDTTAELVGKEASIFLPTGTMGNLIPIYLLCGRTNEVITHRLSHIVHYEVAGVAAIAGSLPVSAEGERGILKPDVIEALIRPKDQHLPVTKLIEIENTHNKAGGTCYSKADLEGVSSVARKHNLSVHMDGARLFNAAAATELTPSEICSHANTVTFCLSKGLGAPVGSMLSGDADVITEARRIRKLLGGGMRQAGVLAAAGLYALENNIERLPEDHEHAAMIAAALGATEWASLDPVETNIVFFSAPGRDINTVREALVSKGVLCNTAGPNSIRIVTSLEIDKNDTQEICRIISQLEV